MQQPKRLVMSAAVTLLLGLAFGIAFLGTSRPAQAQSVNLAQTGMAELSVAHFAPFGADAAGTSVTVRVNGGDVLTDFVFADVVTGIMLPAGQYTVEVIPTGSVTPAVSAPGIALAADTEYFVAAIGGASSQPLELKALVVDNGPDLANAKVRITHLAPFTDSVPATAVAICDGTSELVSSLAYSDTTGYVSLPPATYDFKVALPGTSCGSVVLDLGPTPLAAGQIVDVFARGLLPGSADASLDLGVYVLAQPLGTAKLSVAHFAPFAADAAGTSVTVRVNGTDVLTDFVFPNVAYDLMVPAGVYTIDVIPTGSVTPALSVAGTHLMSGTEYFVAAVGGLNGQPLALQPLVIEQNAMTDTAKLRVNHLAPIGADAQATAVDVCTEDNTPIISALSYLSSTAYLDLPPAIYDLKVAVAGTDCGTVAYDIAPFALHGGQIVDVFARGGLAPIDSSLEFGLTIMGPGRVAVAHFAPFAGTIGDTAVTVRVDGSDILTDFVFPQIVGYINLDMGEHLVEILPSGSSTPVISQSVTVEALTDYTLAATGFVTTDADLGLDLAVLIDDNVTPPPAGQARLRVGHFAPFADTIDGTRVNLCGGDVPLLTQVPYGAAALLDVAAGPVMTYLSTPDPDTCPTRIFSLPVVIAPEGGIAYLYAVGGRNGLPLQIVAFPSLDLAQSLYLSNMRNNTPTR